MNNKNGLRHRHTSIGDGAFCGCVVLTSISIPNTVVSIGNAAFAGCSSLMSITIPDSVSLIGEYAFDNCYSLTIISFEGAVGNWDAIIKGSEWDYCTGDYTITCLDGSIAKDGTVMCD